VKKLVTIKELQECLAVTPPTIRRAEREGRIKGLRLSPRVVRYDFDAVLAEMAKPQAREPKK
jgi:hypothetical protein